MFTTGMVGYPESLTDPSYRGQILVFTYPLLGNYGVPPTDAVDAWGLPRFLESAAVQVRGVVVRGLTTANHWNSARRLEEWLASEGVPGISGVDTRRLTAQLRENGVMRGVLDVGAADRRPTSEELARRLRSAVPYAEEQFMTDVSPRSPLFYEADGGPLVAVPDCGVKASILRAVLSRGLSALRLPHDAEIPERWDGRPVCGIVVGNGPGDPSSLTGSIDALRSVRGRGVPILGICLGHQLLALARGGSTFKLKYGHRGQNKTIRFANGTALIVSENHGYAVDPASLRGTGLQPWASNPDDGTLEAMRDPRARTVTLQGHPEGHPGPQEAGFVFDQFAERVRRRAP